MRKNFTLLDLHLYDQELDLLEAESSQQNPGPSLSALKNIMNYSRALAIIKTRMAGHYGLLLN